MIKLSKANVVINISGNTQIVVQSYLRVFLSNQRLTDKQLEVATALVSRYTVYNSEGVKEPYASQLLFSTESRKEICNELKIGGAHLNNTFNALCKKDILAREQDKYIINPNIIPNSTLVFNFTIHEEPRPTRNGSSQEIKPTKSRSPQDNKIPVSNS